MKKILFALSFILSCVFTNAQQSSVLTISTTGTSNLKIIFNNKKYSLQDRAATFQSLVPGNYPLTIFQLQQKANGGQEYVKVFDRTITLTAQKHLEVSILRFGKSSWDESYIDRDDWNENYSNPEPNNNPGNQQDYNYRVIDATRFSAIKRAVSNEFNEEEKLNVAKVALKGNWLSVSQIRELANDFFNEERKLIFVKFAYDFCAEQGSYITLSDLFYNNANRKSLVDFIKTK